MDTIATPPNLFRNLSVVLSTPILILETLSVIPSLGLPQLALKLYAVEDAFGDLILILLRCLLVVPNASLFCLQHSRWYGNR